MSNQGKRRIGNAYHENHSGDGANAADIRRDLVGRAFGAVVWVVQMESAGEALKQGITLESFPRGAVISMGVHPRRDGKPAGDRGDSGVFQCPKGSVPKPGMHCDSVEGSKAFGSGILPKETAKPPR